MRASGLLILLLIALTATLVWAFRGDDGRNSDSQGHEPRATGTPRTDGSPPGGSVATPTRSNDEVTDPATVDATASQRESVDPKQVRGLVVRTLEQGTAEALPDVACEIAHRSGQRTGPFARLGTSDSSGTITAPDLPPGDYSVRAVGQDESVPSEVRDDEQTVIEVRLPAATTFNGRVLDRAGNAVAGAAVFVTGCRTTGRDTLVARSDATGDFELTCRGIERLAFARATTKGCSRPVPLSSPALAIEPLILRLDEAVTEVRGRVVDDAGQAVAGARVAIGRHDRNARHEATLAQYRVQSGQLAPRLVELTTDAEGRFRTAAAPVVAKTFAFVRASGFASHRQPLDLEASRDPSAEIEIRLTRGVTLHGKARDRRGQPCGGAVITLPRTSGTPEWLQHRTISAPDGSFRLTNLPSGNLRPRAEHRIHGEASDSLASAPGATVEWHPTLDPGLVITGRLTDERNQPLTGWRITASGTRRHRGFAHTEPDGSFHVLRCRPETYTLKVLQLGAWMPTTVLEREGVGPGTGEVHLQVRDADLASCWITGEVRASDGKARASTASVRIETPKLGQQMSMALPPGPFRLGPLLPARFEVSFSIHGHQTLKPLPFAMTAGQTRDLGTLTAASLGRITVIAVDEDGAPLDTGTLHQLDGRGHSLYKHPLRPAGVNLELPPGRHRVAATAPKRAFGVAALELVPGEQPAHRLRVPSGLPCEFLFHAAKATVQGYLTATWHSDTHGAFGAGPVQVVSGDNDTVSAHRRLVPGNYRVEFASRQHSAEVRFTVAEGSSNRVEVRLQRTKKRRGR
ncbi:MAG: carboxypeptidase-like regulatory domain-containing protein [bacterium]|nr:carboxypeptidase-like regulatory domain-containing protein [bacterium]